VCVGACGVYLYENYSVDFKCHVGDATEYTYHWQQWEEYQDHTPLNLSCI